MTHDEVHQLIDAYADGELDLVTSGEIERHLRSCTDCDRAQENVFAIRRVVRQSSPSYRAPAHLHRQIRRALSTEDKSSSAALWWLVPAVCAVVLLAGWQFWQATHGSRGKVANEIVSSHVRSLLGTHLVDVASSDQHTVKPWFDGKIDFAPPIKDLAGSGFPLVGGRLDYVNDAPAAALVYQRNKHPINVFVQPAPDRPDKPPSTVSVRGYNVIGWSRAGMSYWAISDLNVAELTEFVRLISQ